MRRLWFAYLILVVCACGAWQQGGVPILGSTASGSGGGGTAPTHVTDSTNGSSCVGVATCNAASFSGTAGQLIVVFVFTSSSNTINAPTDNCGSSGGASDTYTSLASNSTHSVLYSTLIGATKTCTVTANIGATPTGNIIIALSTWSGVNATTPVFASTIGNQSSNSTGSNGVTSNAGTGGTISTGQANNVLAGLTADCAGSAETLTAGTGFTLTNTPGFVGNCQYGSENETVASISSGLAATYTSSISVFRNTAAYTVQHP